MDAGHDIAPIVQTGPHGRAVARFARLSGRMQAMWWMLAAALLVTAMGGLVKAVGQRIPPYELAAVRSVFLVTALLPFMLRQGRQVFRTGQPAMMLGRTLTLAIVNLVGFWTLTILPLAYVTAISFSKPLFVAVLAVLLLGERLRLRRSLATLIGFLGVLVMLNPTTIPFGTQALWAALGALLVAMSMAVGVVQVKRLVRTDHPNTIIFYGNLGVVLLMIVPTSLNWVPPSGDDWLLLLLLGLVGLASQNCFIRAYGAAEAGFVAPLEYVRILSAAAVGYVFFAEVPDLWTWVGAAMIAASTLYIARREAILARRSRSAAALSEDARS